MSSFRSAYASGSEPRELVNICLNQIGELPSTSSLGFIYVSDALANKTDAILRLLVQSTGIEHWVGSVGVAICAMGKELYDTPAIAVMTTDLSEEDYRLIPKLEDSVIDFCQDHRPWIQETAAISGILHADPINPLVTQLIEELSESLENGFFTGGLTSSQSQHYQIAREASEGGLSGVLFSSSVEVLAGHTQGCSPLGPRHTVTSCEQNILKTLNHQPAFEVLKNDIGEVLARDLAKIGGYVFAGLPIPHSDTGDYLVRNLLGIDPDRGYLAIGELVNEGDPIMFCRRDGNTATKDMIRMLGQLKKQVDGRAIKGGLYHSCLGRGRYQFGEHSEELSMISDVLGDFPLVGFFANGEIFHNRLYGYTGVITLFV